MWIQVICSEITKWTDIVSAISSTVGVPLVLFTLYKLMNKDKERESEINSLATIATQLSSMQVEIEKRYKASKKPHIDVQLERAQQGNRIKLNFTNNNLHVTLKSFQLANNESDFVGKNATKTTINDVGGRQKFSIILNGKGQPIEWFILHINYTTEEGYVFFQDIAVWYNSGEYLFSPSVIIDRENSAY